MEANARERELTRLGQQHHVYHQMGSEPHRAGVSGDFTCNVVCRPDMEYQQDAVVGGLFPQYTVDYVGREYSQVSISLGG
jgi:hypothetical protein